MAVCSCGFSGFPASRVAAPDDAILIPWKNGILRVVEKTHECDLVALDKRRYASLYSPIWSPDRRTIAYEGFVEIPAPDDCHSPEISAEIRVTTPQGDADVVLSTTRSTDSVSPIGWSPDRMKLWYRDSDHIYFVDGRGRKVTTTGYDPYEGGTGTGWSSIHDAGLSPDGTRIAISGDRAGVRGLVIDVYDIEANRLLNGRRIYGTAERTRVSPGEESWSADSLWQLIWLDNNQVIFTERGVEHSNTRTGPTGTRYSTIVLLNVNNSGIQQLFSGSSDQELTDIQATGDRRGIAFRIGTPVPDTWEPEMAWRLCTMDFTSGQITIDDLSWLSVEADRLIKENSTYGL
ncbi:MAG: hypothetical protein V1748_09675 [Actinomycetota bacterium]